MQNNQVEPFDLFIIGGGINGCGIARDAAGRGLRVALAEKGDLASATSSASTKLFHGGLRYLEYFEVRLVREALKEREVLLRAMPHISWPMRFVLPLHDAMRFESDTPTSRLLSALMPWMKGRRPAWLIRLGLFLYDHLGGRKILPPTGSLALADTPEGRPLQDQFSHAFEYSDCWVDDARLVMLNARDAASRGAHIMTRAHVVRAERDGDLWRIQVDHETGQTVYHARMLVNAAGPWVADTLKTTVNVPSQASVRLVRGSHIVTQRLYEHDKCYFFQGSDGRIIFAIPYEDDFTLIGTTDADHSSPQDRPFCTDSERDYLCAFASRYFKKQITAADVVWSYSGVRPLYDDGARSAAAATRDYTLTVDTNGPPILNVFGGKITTYRKLAEAALARIAMHVPCPGTSWTAGAALPGGDFPVDGVDAQIASLTTRYPFLETAWAKRLVRTYGTEAVQILGDAASTEDLGQSFGATLTAAEVNWMIDREYARCAEDVLWRRSKLGLRLKPAQVRSLEDYIANRLARLATAAE